MLCYTWRWHACGLRLTRVPHAEPTRFCRMYLTCARSADSLSLAPTAGTSPPARTRSARFDESMQRINLHSMHDGIECKRFPSHSRLCTQDRGRIVDGWSGGAGWRSRAPQAEQLQRSRAMQALTVSHLTHTYTSVAPTQKEKNAPADRYSTVLYPKFSEGPELKRLVEHSSPLTAGLLNQRFTPVIPFINAPLPSTTVSPTRVRVALSAHQH
jgi:hypothetical protein